MAYVACITLLLLLYVPASKQDGEQGVIRTDRTWSVWLTFTTCGVDIQRIFSYKVPTMSGEPVQRGYMPATGPLIFQWMVDMADKAGQVYNPLDLLADMSKTTYAVEVYGVRTDGRLVFMKLYIGPAGISPQPIPAAPIRPDRATNWTKDDLDAITAWLLSSHKWVHAYFLRRFQLLVHQKDMRIEMPMRIDAPWCLDVVA